MSEVNDRTRRIAMLPLLAVTAMVLGGCVFGGGDDDPEVTATPERTPSATAVATSEPTGVATASPTLTGGAELPPGLEASAAGTWESRELSDGDEVPDVLGAFVFDVEAGVGTLWSLAPGTLENSEFAFVDTSPGGTFVIAGAPDGNHLVNTDTGASFRWESRTGLTLIDDRGLALFVPTRGGCSFWAVDLAGSEPVGLAAFELRDEGSCNGVSARFSPDGRDLLGVVHGDQFDGGAGLFVVDLESGDATLIQGLDVPSVQLVDGGPVGSLLLARSLSGAAWVASFDWDDRTLQTVLIETGTPTTEFDKAPPDPRSLTVSPDGRFVAWQESDALGTRQGAGGEAEWPVVVIASVERATLVVRAQRVALTNGIRSFHWLVDSSAIVVQSEEGFALLGTDGSVRALPFPLAFHTDPVPLPAPDRADWFAYDGRVVDTSGDPVGLPPAPADAWSRFEDRPASWWVRTDCGWGSDSGRLILVRTEVPGRDYGRGGIATLGLPPRILVDPPAGAGPVRLRVASDGDRLNVRAGPSTNEARLGQFEDGERVIVGWDGSKNFCGPAGCSVLSDPDEDYGERWWVYVTGMGTEGPLAGWIATEFVAWGDR